MRYILLLIPCVVCLLVPFYNSVEPKLFDFPFFYWFQLAFIPISALFIFAAYRMEKP